MYTPKKCNICDHSKPHKDCNHTFPYLEGRYWGLNSGSWDTWVTPLVLSALVFFLNKDHVMFLGSSWTEIHIFMLSVYLGWQTHATKPVFYWLRWNLVHFLPRLASNHDSPNLHLPSNWDYRSEQPHLAVSHQT
jgi:hypothetical protein